MEQTVSEVLRGEVVWFNAKKGYGFIGHGKGRPDFYVHFSKIASGSAYKTLNDGDLVEFTPSTNEEGKPCALDVRVIGSVRPL